MTFHRFSEMILHHKKLVLILFLLAILSSTALAPLVGVNFNMIDYLPKDVASTISLDEMQREYTQSTPNVRVMVPNISLSEAVEIKRQIAKIDGVKEITWLDDVASLKVPLETLDSKIVEPWYKDGKALYALTIDSSRQLEILAEIKEVIGKDGAMSGEPVDTTSSQTSTTSEMSKMMLLVIPISLLILLIATNSWIEPFLFMIAVGASIIMNMGSNILFGEISFVTQTTAAVLQLAVSMDYAVFLLHRFADCRAEKMPVQEAMLEAMRRSASAIFASGLTTVMGFAVLILMRFRIGPDMGIVLAKGIFLSLMSVMILLPVLTVYGAKLIDKTHHRSFLPSFEKFGKLVMRIGPVMMILVFLVAVPSFFAQGNNNFMFGMSGNIGAESRAGLDKALISDSFGQTNIQVLLVPKGNLAEEKSLIKELEDVSQITSIVSYTNQVGAEIPVEFIPDDQISPLISEHYSRIVITLDALPESPETFTLVEKLRSIAQNHFPGEYYLAGESVNIYDMRETVMADNKLVLKVAIGSIALIILLTFKSAIIPFLLLLTIEAAIWINLSVPYFLGQDLNYIGYLIISSVQLGATVDYAILLADRYLENRRLMPKLEAARQTVADTAASILTSASILSVAGMIFALVSTNGVISQLGALIGRGAMLSALLVLLLLPNLLYYFDGAIEKMTLKAKFIKK